MLRPDPHPAYEPVPQADAEEELPLDVLDDIEGEAAEISKVPAVTYEFYRLN